MILLLDRKLLRKTHMKMSHLKLCPCPAFDHEVEKPWWWMDCSVCLQDNELEFMRYFCIWRQFSPRRQKTLTMTIRKDIGNCFSGIHVRKEYFSALCNHLIWKGAFNVSGALNVLMWESHHKKRELIEFHKKAKHILIFMLFLSLNMCPWTNKNICW